jgi:steroid 5-alpha reductase family enzyme
MDMSFLEAYGIGLLVTLGIMTLLWLLSLVLKNSSIVDPFWGTGFVITAWVYFVLTPDGFPARKWLVVTLVTIWGLRLSLYLLWRNWGKGEDFRYQKFRQDAGNKWWWQSLFKVFVLQGILLWIISAPLLAAQYSLTPAKLTALDVLAVLVWAIGFFFEAVGDYQLARFKADPAHKGKVFDRGVWRYTRHPNYFGDATQWWAYYLIALAAGGWWTLFSPIIMSVLLMRVSGVTLLEKTLTTSKPGYKEYVESTSAFFPWLPRKRQGPASGQRGKEE